MTVKTIRTYLLEHQLEQPFGFSQWYYSKRNALLVEVVSDAGESGWGECYGPAAVTQAAIGTFYAPLLVGWSALQNEAAWQHCWRASLDFARKGIMMERCPAWTWPCST
jgi:D-galactarolactone cycloisomerase